VEKLCERKGALYLGTVSNLSIEPDLMLNQHRQDPARFPRSSSAFCLRFGRQKRGIQPTWDFHAQERLARGELGVLSRFPVALWHLTERKQGNQAQPYREQSVRMGGTVGWCHKSFYLPCSASWRCALSNPGEHTWLLEPFVSLTRTNWCVPSFEGCLPIPYCMPLFPSNTWFAMQFPTTYG